MISFLIPGSVFISNPSCSLNFANRCTHADPQRLASLFTCREQRGRDTGESWWRTTKHRAEVHSDDDGK